MSFPLPPEFERAVLDRVRSGQFASPEAVLAAMVELLEDAEAEYDTKLEALRREIDLGIESAETEPLIPGEEVVARLAARLTPPDVAAFIEHKIRDGEYRSFSEAVAAGLRTLMEEETSWDPEELRRELQIGRDSLARGEGIPADEARKMIMNWREEDAA